MPPAPAACEFSGYHIPGKFAGKLTVPETSVSSTARCSFLQMRLRSLPCFLTFHSPSPKTFRPVESITRWAISPRIGALKQTVTAPDTPPDKHRTAPMTGFSALWSFPVWRCYPWPSFALSAFFLLAAPDTRIILRFNAHRPAPHSARARRRDPNPSPSAPAPLFH